ncbi:MAG: helix-hairpin-helix domain-containing protein [Nitrospirae bacterium]|nr:helix-hairpin-helix domain-containing protein [Nitrospirota bacterium]MBI3352318.1 helix-hairpin-helix domain-containing protein [Nitrospirota bacterium]
MKNLFERNSRKRIRVFKFLLFFLALGTAFGLRGWVSQQEIVPPQPSQDASALSGEGADEKKVNLNQASLDNLMTLPGIGEKLAKRIKEYQDLNGPFPTIESVMEIKGVGSKNFNKIKPYITVE